MLKYLVQTTIDLIGIMLMTGIICGYAANRNKRVGVRFMQAGVILGVVSAIAMSIMKNATSKINTGWWNLGIYSVTAGAFVLFLLFSALRKPLKKAAPYLTSAMLAVIVCMLLFYGLPDVLAYPYTVYVTEYTVLSTTFITKTIGVILGLALGFIAALSVGKAATRVKPGLVFALLSGMLLANTVKTAATSFSFLLARRLITNNHTMFVFAKYCSNYVLVFSYIHMALSCVIALTLWVLSFHVNEPYENPAQHRKIRAKRRSNRRWSTSLIVCCVLSVCVLTFINAYANKEVELSPIEDALIEDGAVKVSFEQVNDGHLHRFGYTTDSGTTIRFIIIQKPNSSAYGVGLDACDICGETGYYEKGGQVVCNLCDVVMNINTIGFKGGCNPIVIDYSIQNGYIIVPIEGLLEYESEFK